jgi:hypothetical protein
MSAMLPPSGRGVPQGTHLCPLPHESAPRSGSIMLYPIGATCLCYVWHSLAPFRMVQLVNVYEA